MNSDLIYELKKALHESSSKYTEENIFIMMEVESTTYFSVWWTPFSTNVDISMGTECDIIARLIFLSQMVTLDKTKRTKEF